MKDNKYEFTSPGLLGNSFDDFPQEVEQEKFDLNDDMNLSAEEKQDLDEYNEQMIPNPNFYKINNEVRLNDQQINKDHDSLRNELGFSPGLSKYPSRADMAFDPISSDYGIENKGQGQDIKMKRNTRDFDRLAKRKVNKPSFAHLSDQDDTTKNNLSHEADYKLSKSEQESHDKLKPNVYLESQSEPQENIQHETDDQFPNEFTRDNEPQNNFINTHASAQNDFENHFRNEYPNENTVHNEFQGSFQNTRGSYNSFKETLEPKSNFNKKSFEKTANSKTNFLPKDPKLQKHLSRQGKSNPLANEINLKISNRMMSKGLGPSLPSESVKYNPNAYRHPMNIDVENQRWRDRRHESRNDFNDYIGRQRRLLQFDYDDSDNIDPQHENNLAPNDNKPTDSKSQLSNTVATEKNEKINPKELEMTPSNSTIGGPDNMPIDSVKNTNQSESNSSCQTGHVDSLRIQVESNTSNANQSELTAADHGKIVKRSVSSGKANGVQE